MQNPQPPPDPVTSCLKDFNPADLQDVIERCDAAITAAPEQTGFYRDRALVLTLAGEMERACADVTMGLNRLKQADKPVDPMLRHELEVRQETCKQSRTIAGSD